MGGWHYMGEWKGEWKNWWTDGYIGVKREGRVEGWIGAVGVKSWWCLALESCMPGHIQGGKQTLGRYAAWACMAYRKDKARGSFQVSVKALQNNRIFYSWVFKGTHRTGKQKKGKKVRCRAGMKLQFSVGTQSSKNNRIICSGFSMRPLHLL